ncbi:MAG: PD-(D/E)XK nuclease family protein [bacterium]
MQKIDVVIGKVGSGKTKAAIQRAKEILKGDFQSVRVIVPTIGQKSQMETLMLGTDGCLPGRPVMTFFDFAVEIATSSGVLVKKITDLQKMVVLRHISNISNLGYFANARKYSGFITGIDELIDECKVHMVEPGTVIEAAGKLDENKQLAAKLADFGSIYQQYQQWLINNNFYDNEGLMWIANNLLRDNKQITSKIKLIMFDGFSRLTPVQAEMIGLLKECGIPSIIINFDAETDRKNIYTPVFASLEMLSQYGIYHDDDVQVNDGAEDDALHFLQKNFYNYKKKQFKGTDESVVIYHAATPNHEAEMIAREIIRLQRDAGVSAMDIAVVARNSDRLREKYSRIFARFGLNISAGDTPTAYTSVGKALISALKVCRDGWKREDIFAALRTQLYMITEDSLYQIDLIAREYAIFDGKESWRSANWPDDKTCTTLEEALEPLYLFDEMLHRAKTMAETMVAIRELLKYLYAVYLNSHPDKMTIHDITESGEIMSYHEKAFKTMDIVLEEMDTVAVAHEGISRDETISLFIEAISKKRRVAPGDDGVRFFSVNNLGGEKMDYIFLCDLIEGHFPHYQRESIFLADHNRDDHMKNDLKVNLPQRRALEEDEKYWFIHTLYSTRKKLYLTGPQNSIDGSPLEISSFLDETRKLLPKQWNAKRTTLFRDLIPAIDETETAEEFINSLILTLHTADDAQIMDALAGYHAMLNHPEMVTAWREYAQRNIIKPAMIKDDEIRAQLAVDTKELSASRLQLFSDCPFKWFASYCLQISEINEELSPLELGTILHEIMSTLIVQRGGGTGINVRLHEFKLEDLQHDAEQILLNNLRRYPRHNNSPKSEREIRENRMTRRMNKFLAWLHGVSSQRQSSITGTEMVFSNKMGNQLLINNGETAINGRLDRVDVLDDGSFVVIDYKSSVLPTKPVLAKLENIQVLVYLLAMEKVFNYDIAGMELISVNKRKIVGIFKEKVKQFYGKSELSRSGEMMTDEKWNEYIVQAEDKLTQLAKSIQSGEIRQVKTDKCKNCGYREICRVSEVVR